jgi:hypothetical protein
MPFYTDPITKMEHKFAWYAICFDKVVNLFPVIIVFEAIVQQTVLTMTGLCSIFERKADLFLSALNVARFVRTDPSIHVVNVRTGSKIKDWGG